jgi:hypothetical protein
MQSRGTSPNDQAWVDAWAFSTVAGITRGLRVGATNNEVRDGVANPNPNQPQLSDKAEPFGLRYRADQWYAAGTCAVTTQHEVDDLGRRFDGQGLELALRYYVRERVTVAGAYNDLRPDSNHPGDFRVRFGLASVVYNFGAGSRVFAAVRIEGGRRSDGSDGPKSAFATGLNLTF